MSALTDWLNELFGRGPQPAMGNPMMPGGMAGAAVMPPPGAPIPTVLNPLGQPMPTGALPNNGSPPFGDSAWAFENIIGMSDHPSVQLVRAQQEADRQWEQLAPQFERIVNAPPPRQPTPVGQFGFSQPAPPANAGQLENILAQRGQNLPYGDPFIPGFGGMQASPGHVWSGGGPVELPNPSDAAMQEIMGGKGFVPGEGFMKPGVTPVDPAEKDRRISDAIARVQVNKTAQGNPLSQSPGLTQGEITSKHNQWLMDRAQDPAYQAQQQRTWRDADPDLARARDWQGARENARNNPFAGMEGGFGEALMAGMLGNVIPGFDRAYGQYQQGQQFEQEMGMREREFGVRQDEIRQTNWLNVYNASKESLSRLQTVDDNGNVVSMYTPDQIDAIAREQANKAIPMNANPLAEPNVAGGLSAQGAIDFSASVKNAWVAQGPDSWRALVHLATQNPEASKQASIEQFGSPEALLNALENGPPVMTTQLKKLWGFPMPEGVPAQGPRGINIGPDPLNLFGPGR